MNNKGQPPNVDAKPTDRGETGSKTGSSAAGEAMGQKPALEEIEPRPLTPAAKRALAEAEARRHAAQKQADARKAREKELGGRNGPEPTRYGDWEKGGIVSDF